MRHSFWSLCGIVLSQREQATALCFAAERGHDEVVRLLLQHGAKIDHQVCTIHVSCQEFGFAMHVLLPTMTQSAVTINLTSFYASLQDVHGQTALYLASSGNHCKVVETLLVCESMVVVM